MEVDDEDDDGTDDEAFALISLATDEAMIVICAVSELWKLDDVINGRRPAYLRGAEPTRLETEEQREQTSPRPATDKS